MIINIPAQAIRVGMMAFALVVAGPAGAQQAQPSANAVQLAKEIIVAKGASKMYEPVIVEVVERAKGVLVQTNPTLAKDLNDVAAKVRTESEPRVADLLNEVAKMYAARFTEAELRDVLAFYKSAVGQKIIVQEPAILDQSVAYAENWASRFSEEVLAKMRAEMKKKGHDL